MTCTIGYELPKSLVNGEIIAYRDAKGAVERALLRARRAVNARHVARKRLEASRSARLTFDCKRGRNTQRRRYGHQA